jgi:hypothetical protein
MLLLEESMLMELISLFITTFQPTIRIIYIDLVELRVRAN